MPQSAYTGDITFPNAREQLKFLVWMNAELDSLNKTPETCKDLFSGVSKTREALEARYEEIPKGNISHARRALINSAYIVARLNMLLKEGDKREAGRDINELVTVQGCSPLLGNVNQRLNWIGSSYEAICFEKGRFLIPDELDEYVFNRWAPKDSALAHSYSDKKGLLVAAPGYHGRTEVVLDAFRDESLDLGEHTPQGIPTLGVPLIERVQFHAKDARIEDVQVWLEANLGESTIRNFTAITSERHEVANYLGLMYYIKRGGRSVRNISLEDFERLSKSPPDSRLN